MRPGFDRRKARPSPPEVTAQAYDPDAAAIMVRAERGRPFYTATGEAPAAESDATWRRVVEEADETPAATELGFDLALYPRATLLWRNAGEGTRESLDIQVWVLTELGWVQAQDGAVAGLLPNTERAIPNTCYRRVFVQVTALNGGAGNAILYCGGE